MRGDRLNLSMLKGMSYNEFVHKADTFTTLVNLKPTLNGLEQRNSSINIGLAKNYLNTNKNIGMTEDGYIWFWDNVNKEILLGYKYFDGELLSDTKYTDVYWGNTPQSEACVFTYRPSVVFTKKKTDANTDADDTDFLGVEYNPALGFFYRMQLARYKTAWEGGSFTLGDAAKYFINSDLYYISKTNENEWRVFCENSIFDLTEDYNKKNLNLGGNTLADIRGGGYTYVFANSPQTLRAIGLDSLMIYNDSIVRHDSVNVGGDVLACVLLADNTVRIAKFTQTGAIHIGGFVGQETITDVALLGEINNNVYILVLYQNGRFNIYDKDFNSIFYNDLNAFSDANRVSTNKVFSSGQYISFWFFNDTIAEEWGGYFYLNDGKLIENPQKLNSLSIQQLPQFEEGLQDIFVDNQPFYWRLNYSPSAGFRPFLGDFVRKNNAYRQEVEWVDDRNLYTCNLWTRYHNENSLWGIETRQEKTLKYDILHTYDTITQTAYAWSKWVACVFPTPLFDTNVSQSDLLIGILQENGYYEVKAYATKTDDIFTPALFANDWFANTVILNPLGGGVLYDYSYFISNDVWEKIIDKGSPTITFNVSNDDGEYYKIATNSYNSGTSEGGIKSPKMTSFLKQEYTIEMEIRAEQSGTNFLFEIREGDNILHKQEFVNVSTLWHKETFMWEVADIKDVYFVIKPTVTSKPLRIRSVRVKLPDAGVYTEIIEYKNISFKMQDAVEHVALQCIVNKERNTAYITQGGLIGCDYGRFVVLEKPVAIAGCDYGVAVANATKTILVDNISGEMVTKELFPIGTTNRNGLDGYGGILAIANNLGVGFVYAYGNITRVSDNLPLSKQEPFVAVDRKLFRVFFNTDYNLVDNVSVALVDTNIQYRNYFAIYAPANNSCYLYAYNTDSKSYVRNINPVGVVICGDNNAFIAEEDDVDARENGYTSEETIVCYFKTKEMAWGNPYQEKNIVKVLFDNTTLRQKEDVADLNYLKFNVLKNINPVGGDVIKTIELSDNINNNSFELPCGVNVFTGGFSATMARLYDSKNPKIIIKDIITMVNDMARIRKNTW